MSIIAFILIFVSALFHATWNILAKKFNMSMAFYAILCSTSALIWLPVMFFTPVSFSELPWQFWASLILSCFSDMILYCGGLVIVYRYWDVSTAYPMVRSLPLLLVAAITGVFGIGSPLNIFAVIGMIMVFSGCLCMPIKDWQSFRWRDYFKLKMVFVLICASGTAGYTIFDSLALAAVGEVYDPQGVSQVVKSLSYYSVREVFLGSILISGSLVIPGQRRHYAEIWRQCRWLPMVAGCLASISYVLVLISMNFVNNVSYIQVFRQMGLLFAVAAGVFILKERVSWQKIAGLLLIICGLCISVIK